MKPIRQISYRFQKSCVVKPIRYENRAKSDEYSRQALIKPEEK